MLLHHMNFTAVVCAVSMLSTTAFAVTRYVDDDAANDPGPTDPAVSDSLEDGSAEHPFDAIQEAIDAAIDGDEVVVLDGLYAGEGNGNITLNGLAITVRSAGGPDACIIDGNYGSAPASLGGFIFENDETPATLVEGFTVRNAFQLPGGGGFLVKAGSAPTVRDCYILDNQGYDYGGGLYCLGGNPTFIGCTFADNHTDWWGSGAAVSGGHATFIDCVFSSHSEFLEGGGIYLEANATTLATVTAINCTFVANQVAVEAHVNTAVHLANCVFVGNSGGGAALNLNFDASATVHNCTFAANQSDFGAIRAGAESVVDVRNSVLWGNAESDDPKSSGTLSGEVSVNTSIVEGGWDGEGEAIIDADPLFAAGPSGTWTEDPVLDPVTYRTIFTDASATFTPGALAGMYLQPDTGHYVHLLIEDNTETTIIIRGSVWNLLQYGSGDVYGIIDIRPPAGSPANDAGDNTLVPVDELDVDNDGDIAEPLPLDVVGSPRFSDDPDARDTGVPGAGQDAIVDLGAYEFSPAIPCIADLDSDETVGVGDLLQLLSAWGDCVACAEDLDDDDAVGVADLLELLSAWGPCG